LRLLQADDREQDGRIDLREALAKGGILPSAAAQLSQGRERIWNEMTVFRAAARRERTRHSLVGHHRDAGERLRIDPKLTGIVERCASTDRSGDPRRTRLTGLFTLAYLEDAAETRLGGASQREKRSIAMFAIDIVRLGALQHDVWTRAPATPPSAAWRTSCRDACAPFEATPQSRRAYDGGSLIAFAPGLTHEQALRIGQLMAPKE